MTELVECNTQLHKTLQGLWSDALTQHKLQQQPAARVAIILALSHAAVAAAHHLLPTELLTVPVSRGNHLIKRAFLSIFRGEAATRVRNAYRALPLRHRYRHEASGVTSGRGFPEVFFYCRLTSASRLTSLCLRHQRSLARMRRHG